jgi:hypothetical protein
MTRLGLSLSALGSFALACAIGACGSTHSGSGFGAGDDGGIGGGDDAANIGDVVFGEGGGGDGGNTSGCSVEAQSVYTLAADNSLYRFDPPSLTFTLVGVLNCQSLGGSPYSMAVDRTAHAWVVYTDGSLFKVDATTAACTSTSFAPGQHGFTTFGMGFSTNSPGSSDETLYVSDSRAGSGSTQGLAKIDTQSLILSTVGTYDALQARAELTGTGDARLFGAFEGTPYVVAQIDKTSAHILSQAPQSAINYPPGSSNFAFAFWGGDFWLFVGPGTSTDVFHYKTSDGTTTKVKSVSFEIVGAGVSTCAPTTPPR